MKNNLLHAFLFLKFLLELIYYCHNSYTLRETDLMKQYERTFAQGNSPKQAALYKVDIKVTLTKKKKTT